MTSGIPLGGDGKVACNRPRQRAALQDRLELLSIHAETEDIVEIKQIGIV
jgi:hypothetical protein